MCGSKDTDLEKPCAGANYVHPIFRRSKGRCLCQSLEQQQECAGYAPWMGEYQPSMCAYLSQWDGVTCYHTEGE